MKLYRKYVIKYSLTAGFFSAILLLQFRGVKIATSSIYGLAGPFILKDKMLKSISVDYLKNFKKKVNDKISKADQEIKEFTNEVENSIDENINERKAQYTKKQNAQE